jgi:hypothetical protein
MLYQIRPKLGIDQVGFGADPDSVRLAFGGNAESCVKHPTADFPCDHFADAGVFAYYRLPGVLEALEFAAPARPTFQGRELLGVAAGEVKRLLEQYDPGLQVDSSGIISHQAGISVYADGWDKDEATVVESVIDFLEGYYS